MRVTAQRVSRAEVRVDGDVRGRIANGLLLFVGFTAADGDEQLEWMVEKIHGLRIFSDEEGKMNRSVTEAGGAVLVVSQFTLYGDASRGKRPSFIEAAPAVIAIPLYETFVERLRGRGLTVETGEFRAMMEVELVNDGPVTIWLEK